MVSARTTPGRRCRFSSRKTGYTRTTPLYAYWEVEGDAIGDDYSTGEISADILFNQWLLDAAARHSDNLIPIIWYVEGDGVFEYMPAQKWHFPAHRLHPRLEELDFLVTYTTPVDPKSGAEINLCTLPVVDRLWRDGGRHKPGFIQEVTGWKPSILQPYVYLPALRRAALPLHP